MQLVENDAKKRRFMNLKPGGVIEDVSQRYLAISLASAMSIFVMFANFGTWSQK